jgi:hypothetical protein
MRVLLVDMKKAHPGQDDALKTCWQTLLKMCGNIHAHPGKHGGCSVKDTVQCAAMLLLHDTC